MITHRREDFEGWYEWRQPRDTFHHREGFVRWCTLCRVLDEIREYGAGWIGWTDVGGEG